MKNMVKCIICTLLLVAFVILSSCSRRGESGLVQSHAADTTVVSSSPSYDSTASKKELSRRSQKDMIRWATLGGM